MERGRLERAMDPIFTGCALLALVLLAVAIYIAYRILR